LNVPHSLERPTGSMVEKTVVLRTRRNFPTPEQPGALVSAVVLRLAICHKSFPTFCGTPTKARCGTLSYMLGILSISGTCSPWEDDRFRTYIFPNGTVEARYLNTTLGVLCQQGSVPPICVDARTPQDIQQVVRFAAKHHLCLVIKDTG
jgi:hypothetical protein